MSTEVNMIYKNIELHNVEEITEIEGKPGVLLSRVPESVRTKLRPDTQSEYHHSTGMELRFVTDFKPADVTIQSFGGACKATLFFGDFQFGEFTVSEEATTIKIPDTVFLSKPELQLTKYNFHPSVVRLLLNGKYIHLIGVNGQGVQPPDKVLLPALRYLAYGTSITHGFSSSSPALAYVKQTAWRLGADAINLGVAGSAYCEKELANYIAHRQDWDFATICASVNMFNQGVTLEEFKEKVKYFIYTIASNNPQKPIICISLFPFFMDVNPDFRWPGKSPKGPQEEYRKALETIVSEANLNNLYFIEGPKLLTEVNLLSYDLLHPSDYGMIQIAENLASFIKPILKSSLENYK